jgi:DNA-binding LacI/PurR family transcriptional regulator
MPTGRRPTSADVARQAGVSRTTVSYVLNNVPHQTIPDATRQRVLEAARELDYTPHAGARALRAGESNLVLLITGGVPYGPNLSIVITALDADVAASGRSLVLLGQQDPNDLRAALTHLQPGVIITLGRFGHEQRALLTRARIPHVEAPREPVTTDHGAILQVRHLARRGHRRIGHLTTADPELAMFSTTRLAGVQAACAALGIDPPLCAALPAGADADATLRGWTDRPDPVTAIACYNDVYAAACLAAADRLGLRVPADLAVIGLDDDPMSPYTRPPLSTVRLHLTDLAHHLWAHAAAALAGQPLDADLTSMGFSLVERDST